MNDKEQHTAPGRARRRRSKHGTYQRIARLYDFLDLPFDYGRYRPLRRQIFEGAGGHILDAGVAFDHNTDRYVSAAGLEVAESRLVHKETFKLIVIRPRRRTGPVTNSGAEQPYGSSSPQ